MRVVDVGQDTVEEDIRQGRNILDAEIAHPSMSVMIVRGNSADLSKFADRVGTRCNPFPWRSAVWVRDERIFTAQNKSDWFGGKDAACAVILDLNDDPAAWLEPDASLFDIEHAWLSAEGHQR